MADAGGISGSCESASMFQSEDDMAEDRQREQREQSEQFCQQRAASAAGSVPSSLRGKAKRGDHKGIIGESKQKGRKNQKGSTARVATASYNDYSDYGGEAQQQLENALWMAKTTDIPLIRGKQNFAELARRFGLPVRVVQTYYKKMVVEGMQPDDVGLYSKKSGANIPREIEDQFADQIMFCDLSEVKAQLTEDEASTLLMCWMQDNPELEIPKAWLDLGGPTTGWWDGFYRRHPDISKANAKRLAEVRVTAGTPTAIAEYAKTILQPDESEDWPGYTPEGMEKYLREQMPEIIAGWSEDRIKKRSYALCHDPRLQANFDQKGHALGGSEVKVLAMKYSRRQCADVADGTWVSVCPCATLGGLLLFISLVVKGNFEVDEDLPDTLWGDETVLASSPTGYSSSAINLEQWKIGIAKLKEKMPHLFPFVCWLDGWAGHTDTEFRSFCRAEGIILMFFRSHSTVWACMLDNGAFGQYERTYNEEIHRLKMGNGKDCHGVQLKPLDKNRKLPFLLAAQAIKKACDEAFQEKHLKRGGHETIWKARDGEMLTLDGDDSGERVEAVEFSVEKAYNNARDQLDAQTQKAASDALSTSAAKRANRRATIVRKKLAAGERVWAFVKARLPLVRGAHCERDPETGEYVCLHCRTHAGAIKKKGATRKWQGGCGTLKAQEEMARRLNAEKEDESAAKAQRKDDRAEAKDKKDAAAAEKAAKVAQIVGQCNAALLLPSTVGEDGDFSMSQLKKLTQLRKALVLQHDPQFTVTRATNETVKATKDELERLERLQKSSDKRDGVTDAAHAKHRAAVKKHLAFFMELLQQDGEIEAATVEEQIELMSSAF